MRRYVRVLSLFTAVLLLSPQLRAAELSPQQAALQFAGMDAPVSASAHRTFQLRAGEGWARYEKLVGQPLAAWSRKEVAYPGGGTVFYPFSGPDFLAVARIFPDADRYVLVAIQRARQPARPESMSATQRAAFESKFGAAWTKFGALGFFRTEDLDDDQSDRVTGIGTTTILMAFAARLGYEVMAVEPLGFNADKLEWEPVAPDAATGSMRLVLQRGARKTTLDYVRLDLSDHGLQTAGLRQAWIQRMAAHPTLLKAASHLLQEPYFSVLRDALVSSVPLLVQDETGLEYPDLLKVGKVRLYGNFAQQHRLFKRTGQRALAAAYKAEKNPGELPFAFSYLKKAQDRSVQVVRRPASS